jgi:PPP family 3-phenylpropionic acid transporter
MSPRLIVAAQYFLYFATLGVYLPFFNLYCYHLGFSGAQIGLLSGTRSVALIIFPLVWGGLADRYNARRPVFLGCLLASTLIWSLLLGIRDFQGMLLVVAAYAVFFAPLIAFMETLSLEVLGPAKAAYGRIRAWGSASFIAVVLGIGPLLERRGLALVVPLILAGAALQTAAALGLPRLGAGRPRPAGAGLGHLAARRPLVFLTCGFLMLFSHGTYYGFFSIHLETLGQGPGFIGLSWAVAVLAEIVVMVNSDRLFRRFSLESVLQTAFAAAVLRWLILAASATPGVILLSQSLHAATYGAFHMASILFMDRLAPETHKTVGQAVNNAVSYGLGLMVGFLVSGGFYDRLGPAGLFALSAGAALAGGALFAGLGGRAPGGGAGAQSPGRGASR